MICTRRYPLLFALASIPMLACDTPEGDELSTSSVPDDRGPLGKADGQGTCVASVLGDREVLGIQGITRTEVLELGYGAQFRDATLAPDGTPYALVSHLPNLDRIPVELVRIDADTVVTGSIAELPRPTSGASVMSLSAGPDGALALASGRYGDRLRLRVIEPQ